MPIQVIFFLAACQPGRVTTVEVTRLVERLVTEPAPPPAPTATLQPSPTLVSSPLPTVITMTVTVEVTRPPLGTEQRPVQLLFPPLVRENVILERGQVLADELHKATGREFVIGVVDSEEVLVDLLCNAPGDTIGFISSAAYVMAHDQCAAQAGLVARNGDGLTWEAGMLVAGRGSGLNDLEALDGARWAVADATAIPTYLYFQALLAATGVESGEVDVYAEDSTALLALTEGETDFTTAAFVPPLMPFERDFVPGEDDPEEWRYLSLPPRRSPIGYVLVAGEPENGGYRVRDARSRLFDTYPDIFDQTRIVAISEPIPNETIVLGADFPLGLARLVLETMQGHAAGGACQQSLCSADFMNWSGLEPADDASYDSIRFVIDELNLTPEDVWTILEGT